MLSAGSQDFPLQLRLAGCVDATNSGKPLAGNDFESKNSLHQAP
jgi:hypothetical protein